MDHDGRITLEQGSFKLLKHDKIKVSFIYSYLVIFCSEVYASFSIRFSHKKLKGLG